MYSILFTWAEVKLLRRVFVVLADESGMSLSSNPCVWHDPDELCFNRDELALGHGILRKLSNPRKVGSYGKR